MSTASTVPRAARYGLMGLLFCAIAVTVYYGVISDRPLPDHRLVYGINDLVLHLVTFFVLALVSLALWSPMKGVLSLVLLGALVLELCQTFRSSREVSAVDIAASMAGALAAGALVYLRKRLVNGMAGRRGQAPSADAAERSL